MYAAEGNSFDIAYEGLEVVQEGDWEQDYKYQHRTSIVKFDGDFFAVHESRAGSPFTDWHYGVTTIEPVERREETKIVVTWPATGDAVEVSPIY